ncbi:DMT family transporter [Planotetraspora sp. A-T 1434]|uniref:DMT family transporter n=1 Tax=Planotetraspora sp. A-T 1434 TaxID=2979219 RepID=UPI0021BEAFBD|nr:DMT family transporter [Planotetraspora sp. A-T 1434]MCT9933570.1 DMT family transporter [Planotetraspora sp. A-T 1434]
MFVIIAISLGAACLLGLGFVAQQHAAYREPLKEMLHPHLILDLVRMPLWLIGIGLMLCGQILGAVALREASMAWVEPILATNLLFALAAAHVVYQEHFGRTEWLGAVLVSGGASLFLLFGQPNGDHLPEPGSMRWLAVLAVIVVAAWLVFAGLRRSLKIKAMLLAAAAGVLYGLQDVLTHSSLLGLSKGFQVPFETWQPYTLLCVAVVGLLLNQSAFDAAPLQISLPATTAAEPITGIVLGIAIFAERLRVSPEALAAEVIGLIAMVAGIVILGRSPFLAKSEQNAAPLPDGKTR